MASDSIPVNPDACSDLHYERVGRGYVDADGQPTRDGVWYLVGDHEPSRTDAVILSGALEYLPHALLPRERYMVLPVHLCRQLARLLPTLADVQQKHGELERAAFLRTVVRELEARADAASVPTSSGRVPDQPVEDEWEYPMGEPEYVHGEDPFAAVSE